MDDETYDYLAGVAATVEVSPCEFLDRSVFLDSDPYERLTTMAQQARANEAQFLEHLILRAEVIWNFQPPLPPSRPWWKLWGRACRRDARHRGLSAQRRLTIWTFSKCRLTAFCRSAILEAAAPLERSAHIGTNSVGFLAWLMAVLSAARRGTPTRA